MISFVLSQTVSEEKKEARLGVQELINEQDLDCRGEEHNEDKRNQPEEREKLPPGDDSI